jgi:hypothetical protein
MVNIGLRPNAIHIKPCKPMGKQYATFNIYKSVPVGGNGPRSAAGAGIAVSVNSPSKNTCLWCVIQ